MLCVVVLLSVVVVFLVAVVCFLGVALRVAELEIACELQKTVRKGN